MLHGVYIIVGDAWVTLLRLIKKSDLLWIPTNPDFVQIGRTLGKVSQVFVILIRIIGALLGLSHVHRVWLRHDETVH